jgi:hypothetical protein
VLTKTSGVDEAQLPVPLEGDDDVGVLVERRGRVAEEEPAAHAHVDDDHVAPFEVQQQIFAAPRRHVETATPQPGREIVTAVAADRP